MSKIFKLFKAIILVLKKPYLLNLVINDEDRWKRYINKNYKIVKSSLPVVRVEQLFMIKEQIVEPYTFTDGGSLITDLLLLRNAAANIDNCSYFEIGTWRGESVANVSKVAKDCYTLNLSDDEIRKMGFGDSYIEQIGCFSKFSQNIIHLKGDSLTFDYSSLNKKFDLIFIDGNHHYDYVKSDTINTFEYLTHDNSIVIWHDYGFNPEKVRYQVLTGILDGTPKEKHKNIYHVEDTLSAIYFPGDLKGKGIKPKIKTKIYTLYTVEIKKKLSEF